MRRSNLSLVASAATWFAAAATSSLQAATATFTPVGPTSVESGQVVTFEVVVASTVLGAFDTADVIIGSATANDVGFTYSNAWSTAFANVTMPSFDNGVYTQDVYGGGNNPTSVGSSLALGTVTLDTTAMPCGSHSVIISHSLDGVSALGLGGTPEALEGFGTFEITLPGGCLVAPTIVWNTDPAASSRGTRSLTPSVIAAIGQTGTAAIQLRSLDLQNPNPANATCCPPPDFSAFEVGSCSALGELNACVRWVGPAQSVRESQDIPALGIFPAARLQCTPYYTDWSALGSFSVFGAEILPSSSYELTAYASSCTGTEATCTNVSAPVQMLTRRSGDVLSFFNPPAETAQPDGNDVVALVNKFKNLAGAPSKTSGQIFGNVVELNADVNGLDIGAVVDAFKGLAYPYGGPCPCPPTVTCNATPCANAAPCSGGSCVRTCTGGTHNGLPCRTDVNCQGGGTCPESGFCRDRCARCQ